MLIDFHTHLDFYKDEELAPQLKAFSGAIIAASVDEKSFLRNLQIAAQYNSQKPHSTNAMSPSSPASACRIIPTFGIHPNAADENAPLLDDPATAARFTQYLYQSPLIGEIGMDFCWAKSSRKNQEKVFRWCLEYCNRTEKVCVIHTKDAEKEIADILLDYPKARPVIHWYDGPENIFREFISRGYPQTFGVESIRSPHIQKLLQLTPPQLLLAETDNPDSEPWLGGSRNDVALIERVYTDLAGLLKISRSGLEKLIEENFYRLLPALTSIAYFPL